MYIYVLYFDLANFSSCIEYSLNKAINVFSINNLVDSAIQENAAGTGNREEGALLTLPVPIPDEEKN